RVMDNAFDASVNRLAQQSEIYRERRQPLTDVVVQLTRDPRTLPLVRIQQSGGEIVDARVTSLEVSLTSTQSPLCFPSFCHLNEQPGDQRRLHEQRRQSGDDVDLVAIPDRGFPTQDL